MAFIPATRGIRVSFHFLLSNSNFLFTLGLQKGSGSITTTDLENAADIGETWAKAECLPIMDSDTDLVKVAARDISVDGGAVVENVCASGCAATGGAGEVPINAAICVSLRTAKSGRSYRGRMYFGGLVASQILDETHIESAYATSIGEAFQQLLDDFVAGSLAPVIWSRQHNGVETNPQIATPVTALIVDSVIDSQRRRLLGRGT